MSIYANTPIESAPFETRVRTAFRSAGIATVGEVEAMTDRELLLLPYVGRRCLRHIREVLTLVAGARPLMTDARFISEDVS